MNKRICLIGVGNAGSMVASLAAKRYGSSLFDSVYINSSDADLSQIKADNTIKFKIGDREEIEGSGKNRLKMKQYLREYIKSIILSEEFTEMLSDKKYVFIIASTAGGTGSGSAPVLFEILRMRFPDIHFILVGILPKLGASLMEQGNSLEFLNELYTDLGDNTTYMIYDNETVSDKSPTEGLEIVNENIVEDIRIITGVDNYPTPYESIDMADMESIVSTPGRLLVARVTKGITEKAMEDVVLDDLIIKAIKSSCNCETDRNKKVARWGITTYFTDAVNKLFVTNFEKLTDFIGTPIERFNHNAINEGNENLNFLHLIASGLSPINDRTKKIMDRVEELKNALRKDKLDFILNEDISNDEILSRKNDVKKNRQEEFNIDDIFGKFMK